MAALLDASGLQQLLLGNKEIGIQPADISIGFLGRRGREQVQTFEQLLFALTRLKELTNDKILLNAVKAELKMLPIYRKLVLQNRNTVPALRNARGATEQAVIDAIESL